MTRLRGVEAPLTVPHLALQPRQRRYRICAWLACCASVTAANTERARASTGTPSSRTPGGDLVDVDKHLLERMAGRDVTIEALASTALESSNVSGKSARSAAIASSRGQLCAVNHGTPIPRSLRPRSCTSRRLNRWATVLCPAWALSSVSVMAAPGRKWWLKARDEVRDEKDEP